jgi:hypothetical protein
MESIITMARTAGYIVLFSLIPIHSANCDFIPLLGGLIVYNESATAGGDFATGTDQFLAENIQVASGGAFGYASNTVGSGLMPALTQASASANELGAFAFADADITFRARLIKLHPDAPDDIGIPLLFTSSLSATEFGNAELVIGAGAIQLQEQGTIDVDSSLSVLANDFITTRVSVSAQADFLLSNSASASASTPVFAIDPAFTVEFLGRTERAVDLYTLAVTPDIGFAGDFQTVTPFTDGCLPDPSILTTSGTPSVIDGSTVTCQAIDPSGFRSYGNDPGDLSGVLNDIEVVVTAGATVETDEDGSPGDDAVATIGLLGEGNSVLNEGTVRARGQNSNAIFASTEAVDNGVGFDLINRGDIETELDESEVVLIIADEAGVVNEGNIRSFGLLSSGVVVEGDGAFVLNEGSVITTGQASSGLVVEGNSTTFGNTGMVDTWQDFSAGIVILGNDSVGDIDNSGGVETRGDDAQGMLVIGQNHSIRNLNGTITTAGERAHGIALGLQEVVLPPGVEVPPEIFNPASGSINHSGNITTTGAEADAIHAFANNIQVRNFGELNTTGSDASGISIIGNDASVTNDLLVNTSGENTRGIAIFGDAATVENRAGAEIISDGNNAAAVSVSGNSAEVTNKHIILSGGTAAHTIEVIGDSSFITNDKGSVGSVGPDSSAIFANSRQLTILNTFGGSIQAEGERAAAINILSAEQATVTNQGSVISEGALTEDNYGIKATFTGTASAGARNIFNLGEIRATGVGAHAVDLIGDRITIKNGATGITGASITATGGGNIGIAIKGRDPQVTNEAPITVGDGLFPSLYGIEVTPTAGGGFLVENSSTIGVNGDIGVGMVLRGADAVSSSGGGFSPGACVPSPGGRNLSNCGSIQLAGSGLTGMLLEGTSDSFIENQIQIIGSGANVRGMVVEGVGASVSTDNVVTNFDEILLDGTNATGILVKGALNTVLSGSGATLFPDGNLIDSFLDFVTSDDDDGTGPRTGNITVVGDGAAGIIVEGDSNRVGVRAFGQVVANGANAVGVKLLGNDNLLVNDGVLVGTGAAVLGSNGVETVLNDGVINGDVNLMAGEDTMIITDATVQLGVVDGGDNIDTLRVVVPRPGIADPVSFISRVDGSEYINFENVIKEGNGTLSMVGNLMTWNTQVQEGQFSIENGVLLETVNATIEGTGVVAVQTGATIIAGGDIVLNEFGTLGVLPGGVVSATDILVNSGSTLFGRGRVIGNVSALGGLIMPGTSPGTLTIEGDLLLESGVLELEAASLIEKDTLVVGGDALFSGGFVDVILGFTPEPDDVLEFLVIQGTLGVLEGFGGIRGIAAAGSNVALGTEFTVLLGDQPFQGIVTSAVPLPPSMLLFGAGLIGLVAVARRKAA